MSQSATDPSTRALERSGHRVTDARRTIASLVDARVGHFTAADLIADARARRQSIGRATIFRSLDLFTDLRVVERVDLPTGEHAYVPCEPMRQHHHHIVCSGCGRTTDVADCGITAVTEEASRRTGYRIDNHRLELFGLCPPCQARVPSDPRL
jgi:Fe2+ or Zn2+ uptake regulation protein